MVVEGFHRWNDFSSRRWSVFRGAVGALWVVEGFWVGEVVVSWVGWF